jgi:glycine betaine/choline ABC-type transport system substrate-binding protein
VVVAPTPAATAADSGTLATTTAADPPVDPDKRARKLKKILKQIDDLKLMAPSDLNDDQKAKIASEVAVRAELEQLGL